MPPLGLAKGGHTFFKGGAMPPPRGGREVPCELFLIESSNSYQKLFTKLKNIALSLKYCWSKVSAVV